MASCFEVRVRFAAGLVLVVLGGVETLLAQEPARLSLEQASSRNAKDFSPVYEGRRITVNGKVSSRAHLVAGYNVLPLAGERGGIAVRVRPNDDRLRRYAAGDELEVTGTVANLAGAPVLDPDEIVLRGRMAPDPPITVPVKDLQGFRYLCRLVHTEGEVVEAGENTAGSYALIASGKSGPFKVFYPHTRERTGTLPHMKPGDRLSVTGVAFQYCPRPPYNRWFEVLIHDQNDVAVTGASWTFPVWVISLVLATVALLAWAWWSRERRMRNQRERLRRIYHLGEEIVGAPSIEWILTRVGSELPGILGVTRVRLYLHNRADKTLEAVAGEGAEPVSIELASPPGGTYAGAAACYHYRTLLAIPDLARSPFPVSSNTSEKQPKSLLFVPMMAQGEVVGVFELDQDDRPRDFTHDEQSLAQHLGNQIGVAMRLLDQRSVREQLYRSEKLAAVGRLISGVVNDLRTPLASIAELAAQAQQKPHLCPAEREIRAIGAEAQKAKSIVARLVSFASEPAETRPVDLNALVRNLIEFRSHDWKASGLKVRDLTGAAPMWVMGWQGQLEQVLLNLMVHAEQTAVRSADKVITVQTSLMAKRVLVEIAYGAPSADAADDSLSVLSVARSVIAGHGGEVRLVRTPGAGWRFEVDLPSSGRDRTAAPLPSAEPARQLTALVVEPEESAQRQLVALLSARGHRAVPIGNTDTALEVAQRMRFDVAFCSVHSPGLNWIEFSERLQGRLGAFILLSDGYDAELAADFEGEGRFVLAKPVQEVELDRMLAPAEPSMAFRVRTA
jgi:CheY-like chemotaxis protein